jgi:hypothetical protein
MNMNRLVNDDEDEEYIRRPMSSLTTSTTPIASSNITMISSSDLSSGQGNEKQNKSQNQSLPKAQDFPALPSTTTIQNNSTNIFTSFVFHISILIIFIAVSSSVWTAGGTNSLENSLNARQKKKSAAMSKKKFMEEVQALPPPPSLSSTNDFPSIGLSELGRRLINEENESTVTTQVKEEKSLPQPLSSIKKEKPLPTPQPASSIKKEKPLPSPQPSSSSIKQEKKEENNSTVQSNKKVGIVDDWDLAKIILD